MTNSTRDRVKSQTNEIIGKTKEIAGKISSNPKLQAEGENQQIKGDIQKATIAAKDVLQKGVQKAGDLIEKAGKKLKS